MSAPEVNESLKSLIDTLNWIVERDPIGHAPAVFTYEHHQIHEGNLFTGGTLTTINGTLGFHFIAGPSLRPHFVHGFNLSGQGSLHLYQNPTIGTLGNIIDVWNHLMGDAGTATMIMYASPAVADVGTWRTTKIAGGTGVGGSSQSGEGERVKEIVFAADQEWLAVAETDGELVLTYEATWYEK